MSEREHDALDTLLAWTRENVDWSTAEEIFARVMRATYADAWRTAAAATSLCHQGYGREALKLGRSLLESTIVAHWAVHCAPSPDWVLERMREHLEFNNVIWLEVLARTDWGPAPDYPQEKIDWVNGDRERLAKAFGAHGELSWWAAEVEQNESAVWKRRHTRNLAELVSDLCQVPELEDRIWRKEENEDGTPEVTSTLGLMLAVPQRFNNQLLHHNPAGLTSLVDVVDDEITFDDEPSDDWVGQALFFLYANLAFHTALMLRKFRPDLVDEFESVFDPVFNQAFVRLSDEQLAWARNNRNKACPCGSGVKSKRCHLA